jgi:hypothetical protein
MRPLTVYRVVVLFAVTGLAIWLAVKGRPFSLIAAAFLWGLHFWVERKRHKEA